MWPIAAHCLDRAAVCQRADAARQNWPTVDPFGEITNTSSDGMVVLETTVNAASALLGGGTNQSRDFSVTADPQKYSSGAENILKKTNADLILSMQTAK